MFQHGNTGLSMGSPVGCTSPGLMLQVAVFVMLTESDKGILCVVITVVIVEANNTKENNNATFKFKLPPPSLCFFIPKLCNIG